MSVEKTATLREPRYFTSSGGWIRLGNRKNGATGAPADMTTALMPFSISALPSSTDIFPMSRGCDQECVPTEWPAS